MTVIVCRCEDITEADIIKAVEDGYTELEVLKRHLRLGMGPCQGKTCMDIAEAILSRETGRPQKRPTARPPVRQVAISILAGEEVD